MWCVFCLDTSLFNLRLIFYLWVLSGKWKARYIPNSGRKNEIIVTRIISTPSSSPPCPLLVEVFAFFAEVGTWIEKTTWLVTVKSLVLSCQNCWHMKDWTLFKKKKVKMREWTVWTLIGSLSCIVAEIWNFCKSVMLYLIMLKLFIKVM